MSATGSFAEVPPCALVDPKADSPLSTQKRSLGGRSNLQTYRADQYKRYAQILYKT